MGQPSVHGCNKCWRDLGDSEPLHRRVRALVEQKLFLAFWFSRSIRSQLDFRRRCDKRWQPSSPFVVFTEGWFLLRDHERLDLLREVSLLDLEFGHAMLTAVCVQQDPTLDTMD